MAGRDATAALGSGVGTSGLQKTAASGSRPLQNDHLRGEGAQGDAVEDVKPLIRSTVLFPQRTSFSTADEFFAECSKRLRAQFGYPANPSKRKDDKVTVRYFCHKLSGCPFRVCALEQLDGSWFVQSKACTWEHSHAASTTPLPLPVSTEPLPPSQPPATAPSAVSTAADPPRPSPSSAHPESDPQLAPIATRLALLVIPHGMLSFLGYSLSEEMQQVVLDELEQRLRLQLW